MGVKVREKPKNSGVWWIFIAHNGKRKSKKIGKDKKLALEAAKKIEAKLALGDMGLDEKEEKRIPIFEEYSQTWITVTVPATCKYSTLKDYQTILKNHVLPVFGKTPVTEINRMMVKRFLMDKTNAGFAASTVTHMKNTIGGVLNLAVDDEIIAGNPAHRLGKVIRSKSLRIEIDPLNREELSHFLTTFKDNYPSLYPLALTLARTGMRLGEALALQWGDIDFRGRFINIQRGFSRGRLGTPKNHKSRKVDMSQQLADTLRHLRHERKAEALKKGWGSVPDWVFVSTTGTPLDPSHFRNRVFNRVIEKTGLRKIRVHDLRHSYASLLIQAGESLAYVRDQLGHHSIKVTVDIYGHLAPEGNKAAVDHLDDEITAPTCTLSAPKSKKGVNLVG